MERAAHRRRQQQTEGNRQQTEEGGSKQKGTGSNQKEGTTNRREQAAHRMRQQQTEGNKEQTEEGGCPDSWVLTYSLDGRIDITDTPLNIGNADAQVGGLESDELVIRVADDDGIRARRGRKSLVS